MEYFKLFFSVVGDFTWGWALIPLLVVFGLFITLFTGFAQLQFFGRMFKSLTRKKQNSDNEGITARQALFVSVGGRVGGGNIAGVAVAITLGGPGAVFWMWMIAFVGMATSLVECSLAQLYKRRLSDGTFNGGPGRAILHGLGENYRWLAVIYAICLIASFAIGFVAFQGNTVAGAMQDSMGFNRYVTGGFLALGTAYIVFGGIHRIAKISDFIIPVMALSYILIAFAIILINITDVPSVISIIIKNAFGLEEAVSGGMGVAIAQGIKRGLFSNEAGLGSAPNVAAAASVKHPISQGITQSLSVFIDTIVICTCTALVILLSDVYAAGAKNIDGVVLTQQALVSHLGSWAQYFLSLIILMFAFSSIIYNYYLGENAMALITDNAIAMKLLRTAIVCVVFLGAVAPGATTVFFFSDPLMGVLALINLVVIMMLLPVCIRMLKDFRGQLKAGIENPVLKSSEFSDLDIDQSIWQKEK